MVNANAAVSNVGESRGSMHPLALLTLPDLTACVVALGVGVITPP
jgi:hypothetical protein